MFQEKDYQYVPPSIVLLENIFLKTQNQIFYGEIS